MIRDKVLSHISTPVQSKTPEKLITSMEAFMENKLQPLKADFPNVDEIGP